MHPGKSIEIWFQDEARIGQQGTLERIWAQTGSRPRVLKDLRFESAYIFGAICPSLQKTEAIVITGTGKEVTEEHLKGIGSKVDHNAHAIVIMDNAPWHKSLQIPDNISIIFLPPYSPELNPQENVWDFIRSNFLSNRVYETKKDVIDAACQAWNAFANLPETIKSIGSRSWAII